MQTNILIHVAQYLGMQIIWLAIWGIHRSSQRIWLTNGQSHIAKAFNVLVLIRNFSKGFFTEATHVIALTINFHKPISKAIEDKQFLLELMYFNLSFYKNNILIFGWVNTMRQKSEQLLMCMNVCLCMHVCLNVYL